MKQLIYGGVAGVLTLLTLNTDSTKFAEHKTESVQQIEVLSTKQLIEQTDLYYKVQGIEREIDSLEQNEINR